MHLIPFILAALILSLAQPLLATELATNFTKDYTGSEGVVSFNHQTHADQLKDCAFCHNNLKSFGGIVDEEFGHKFCRACHMTHENIPTDCKSCHKRK
jgi:hypothetical protein